MGVAIDLPLEACPVGRNGVAAAVTLRSRAALDIEPEEAP